VTGIATAFMDSVPLVAITGNVVVPFLGKDSFQEVDITGITMPVVKHNWIVKDLNDLAEIVREAFIVARSGRPGPVLIDIPRDLTARTGEWIPGGKGPPAGAGPGAGMGARARRLEERNERPTFNEEDIDRVVEMLTGARRPMIYAGGGVIISGASKELAELAERLNAPIALSLMGIGAIPRDHRLCTGLIGMHGTVASNKAVQKADLLLALGARFSDRVTSRADKFARRARLLHFDIDPAEINKNARADFWVVGDIGKILRRVLGKLPPRVETGWNGEIDRLKGRVPAAHHRKGGPLHPRFVVEETARRLGDQALAVTDVGQHQMWAAQFFPASRPRSFISPGGLGTMGFGLGAALGAGIANPGRPVVLFTGDGSFRMNCGEMATLLVYRIPVLIVIINNHVLGMVRQWQHLFYGGRYSETLLDRPPDFVKLAGAYGLSGFRAGTREAFQTALDAALEKTAAGEPALVEAVIDRDEWVLPMVPGGKPVDEQILEPWRPRVSGPEERLPRMGLSPASGIPGGGNAAAPQ
jgi:acetolactate synthase-1/2/3 large subunit